MREFFPLPIRADRFQVAGDGLRNRESLPLPEVGPRDLLFKLLLAGILPPESPPDSAGTALLRVVPVGEIAAVGDEVHGWNALDRALLAGCTGEDGVLGEYMVVRAGPDGAPAPIKLPESIPGEEASLLPAAAAAARLLRKADLPPGGRLLVLGLGLVGQILILLSRHHRVERIFAADPSPTLRAKAEYSGATRILRLPEEPLRAAILADTGGQGVHAVAVLRSDATELAEGSRVLAARGTLLIAADFPPGFSLTVAPAWIRRQDIRIQGVAGWGERDLRDAFQAVAQGIVNGENLVSKRIPWSEAETADLSRSTWEHVTQVALLGPDS